jgi:hypothetical protein
MYDERQLGRNYIPPRLDQGRLIMDDFGHLTYEDLLEVDDYGNRYAVGTMSPDVDYRKEESTRR